MDALQPSIDPEADNQAVIQACIDDAHARGGGTVVLPNGRCPIAGPLELRSNVTLRGTGMITTILAPITAPGTPLLVATELLAGATVEDLTVAGLAGAPDADATSDDDAQARPPAIDGAAIDLVAGASFCFLRRLRLVDLPGGALRLTGGPVDHVYLEQIVVEGCAGDGIVVDPSGESTAVFLTEVSVRLFGRGTSSGSAGVRTRGRTFISQLHVQPVGRDACGLRLEAGSDHTVASNLFVGTAGGEAWSAEPGVTDVEVEALLVRDLLDVRQEKVFP